MNIRHIKAKNFLSWSTLVGLGRNRYVFRVVLAGVASWEKMSRKRASQELNWWSEFTKKWLLLEATVIRDCILACEAIFNYIYSTDLRTTDGSTTWMQFCYFLEARPALNDPTGKYRRSTGQSKEYATSKVIVIAWSYYRGQRRLCRQSFILRINKSSFASAKSIQSNELST